MAAIECAEKTGLPEARIPLADSVVLLCLSPKSNTGYAALNEAIADVRSGKVYQIPDHLRDAHYKGAKSLGRGVGYKYPHDYDGGAFGSWVPQQYLPNELVGRRYYQPKEGGREKNFAHIYNKMNESKKK